MVLTVVQALLGFVSPSLRGVAVEFDGNNVTVHFAFSEIDSETSDDVDDVIGDVEGLLWPTEVNVKPSVRHGTAGLDWEGRQHRLVLLAKA